MFFSLFWLGMKVMVLMTVAAPNDHYEAAPRITFLKRGRAGCRNRSRSQKGLMPPLDEVQTELLRSARTQYVRMQSVSVVLSGLVKV